LDATHGYDAMWLAARALDAELKREQSSINFNKRKYSKLTSMLYDNSVNDKFKGASVSDFLNSFYQIRYKLQGIAVCILEYNETSPVEYQFLEF
jgi:hypothetical protein